MSVFWFEQAKKYINANAILANIKTTNTGIQNSLALQEILDNAANKCVVIPQGIFTVRQPMYIKANTQLCVLGTLQLEVAGLSLLAENAVSGANSVVVADGTKFKIGDWVTISDSNCSVQGGGTHTRLIGETAKVANVNENTITFNANLTNNYTTAAGAYLTTQNSIIDVFDEDNITIFGSGTLDGNKTNQTDVEPCKMGDSGEQVRAGCCITAGVCDDLTIKGIEIKNAILHNISLIDHDRIIVDGCKITASHDKNILIRAVRDSVISNNICSYSTHEDGITVYSGINTNLQIIGNRCNYNFRAGILINTANDGIRMANNIMAYNTQKNLIHRGYYGSSIGDVCVGGGTGVDHSVDLTGKYMHVQGLNVRNSLGAIGAVNMKLSNSIVDGLSIIDTNKTRTGLCLEDCTNTNISSIYISGCSKGISTDADTQNVIINNGRFENNTTDIDVVSISDLKVRNIQGLVITNTGTATIASGETTVRIAHGLSFSPDAKTIIVTPTNNLGSATKYWISNIGMTTFTINVDLDPGATTATFTWKAEITDPLLPIESYYNYGNSIVSWVEGYKYGTAELTTEVGYLHLVASDAAQAEIACVSDTVIDLTSINTIYVDWENAGDSSASNRVMLVASADKNAFYGTYDVLKQIQSAFARVVSSLDVSALSGNYYIRVHARDNDGTNPILADLKVYRIWGE